MQVDYLIVGQGIAGSLLALNLMERGRAVLVIDDGHKTAASKVAAGMINPITGRRNVLTWRFLPAWNFLLDDYAKWESILGLPLFYKTSILRLFNSGEDRDLFEKKRKAGAFSGVGLRYWDSHSSIAGLKKSFGGYEVGQSGYVDQAGLIRGVRAYLTKSASLAEDTWHMVDFKRKSTGVTWKQWSAKKIVFTQGFKNCSNPFFRDLPFRNSKGEILVLSGAGPLTQKILNGGKWLMPRREDCYWAGATYDLLTLDQQPTNAGCEEILSGLKEIGNWHFEVKRHQAGVRPALHDFRPVVGLHPWYPEVGIFNGLGSKGSLLAPLLARELTEHLEWGKPLHPQADIDRFRKYL